MTIDIEHYIKMDILDEIFYNENENANVCKIVNEFLLFDFISEKTVHYSLLKHLNNPYSGEIVKKYYCGNKNTAFVIYQYGLFGDYISFGSLINSMTFMQKSIL